MTNTRLSPEERKLVETLARRHGISLSDVIRLSIKEAAKRGLTLSGVGLPPEEHGSMPPVE